MVQVYWVFSERPSWTRHGMRPKVGHLSRRDLQICIANIIYINLSLVVKSLPQREVKSAGKPAKSC
jgi:hypothetical protein